MKRRWIVVTALAAITPIAWLQNVQLHNLKAETAELEQMARSLGGNHNHARIDPDTVRPDSNEMATERVRFQQLVTGLLLAHFEGSRLDREEPRKFQKELLEIARGFSPEDIKIVVDALEAESRLPGEAGLAVAGEIIQEAAPFAWLDYLGTRREVDHWQEIHSNCFVKCLQSDPRRALLLYEQAVAAGNADFATTGVRQGVLMELSVQDPDRMLELAMTPGFAADPDALFRLGGFVDDRMETFADHQRFMAALRRAAAAEPESTTVATIRGDFVREITNELGRWPISEVKPLVDSEFTRDEKLHALQLASQRGDLESITGWADWFLEVDPETWAEWGNSQSERTRHPLVHLAANWASSDPDASAAWLDEMPAGSLRTDVVLEFAWSLADHDPQRAAGYLDELPDSKRKRELEELVESAQPAR